MQRKNISAVISIMIEKTRKSRGLGFYGSILGFLFLFNGCNISQVANPTDPSFATTCIDPTTVAAGHADYRGNNYKGTYGYCLYNLNKLPDTKELYEVDLTLNGSAREGTNFNSNIKLAKGDQGKRVVLYVQGGPTTQIDNFEYSDILENAQFNTEDDWSFVSVYQYQNYYPYSYTGEPTMNQVVEQSAFSAAALYQVAKYFHDQGRKVYIISHSYGSSISPKMMADYKYENYVEKVLVIEGDNNIRCRVGILPLWHLQPSCQHQNTDGLWQELDFEGILNIKESFAFEDFSLYIDYIKDSSVDISPEIIEKFSYFIIPKDELSTLVVTYSAKQIYSTLLSISKLQASLNQYNFIDQYKNFDVPLEKAYFVSGKLDERVGYYSEEEITFAQEKAGGLHLSEDGHDVGLEADLTYYLGLFND